VIWTILLFIVSYLIGAIPFGYLLVYLRKGIDVRTIGSKNLGATNAARALGAPWFAVVFGFDFLKGFAPAYFLGNLATNHCDAPAWIGIAFGVAAMAGHIWPIYLKFQGGKGVATAGGAVTGIVPVSAAIAAVAFIVTLAVGRMVSLGSIMAAVSLPLSYAIIAASDISGMTIAALIAIAVLVVVKHRTNLQRVFAGNENRITWPWAKKESDDA
jgi:glycerol-3-phosphate acyltransferase PlsY